MTQEHAHVLIAVMRRMAQHLEADWKLHAALRNTANALEEYQTRHWGEPIMAFKLGDNK